MADIIKYYMNRFGKTQVKHVRGNHRIFWNYSFVIYNEEEETEIYISRVGCCTEIQERRKSF